MCVSPAPAEFTGTTLYCGRLHHPEHGLIHVLGYQNTAANVRCGCGWAGGLSRSSPCR